MSSYVPKYIKLRDDILADIRSGKLKPGTRIPIREELIKTYSTTRTTINRALSDLIDQGLIRSAGRSGTRSCTPESALIPWISRAVVTIGRPKAMASSTFIFKLKPSRSEFFTRHRHQSCKLDSECHIMLMKTGKCSLQQYSTANYYPFFKSYLLCLSAPMVIEPTNWC